MVKQPFALPTELLKNKNVYLAFKIISWEARVETVTLCNSLVVVVEKLLTNLLLSSDIKLLLFPIEEEFKDK